jgi:ABC-type nitrate/sulfonate/bicarbonate transport system substrate-binding protein
MQSRRTRPKLKLPLFGLIAALALALAACPGEDGDLEEVTLRLNWVIAGNHAPYFYAQSEGYWEECGLDVEIQATVYLSPRILP